MKIPEFSRSAANPFRSINRRSVLKGGAGLVAGAALSGLAPERAAATGGYNIAYSNGFNGNAWRRQQTKAFERAAQEMVKRGIFSKFSAVEGADNSAPAQLAAVSNMILEGNKGILINCTSGTQQNGVIEQAVAAGAKVVTFDIYASSDRSHNLGFDFASWGKNNSDFVEKHLGGAGKAHGNVLIVNLAVAGTAGKLIRDEYQKFLDRNPGIKLVAEVEGRGTRSVAYRNVAQVVPGLPKIDAVLGGGGNDCFGIVQAMLASGYTMENMPPICTAADGDYIQWWREARDKHGYAASGTGSDPESGAWAVYYLAKILEKDDNEPKEWYMPSIMINNDNLDSFASLTGETVPVQVFNYDQIPEVFTQTKKLPG